MLAYVFFHRPAPAAGAIPYEAALRTFHSSLGAAPPKGFAGSCSYRIGGGYADWYMLADSAALDWLNEAAVGNRAQASHDVVARMSSDGAGKLFKLLSGEPRSESGFETRFSKPSGMTYGELYERLEILTARPDVTLWRRMMVLGPPPEFCLASRSELELPAEMSPELLAREVV
ncbi:MAG TPA: hypothetical protein VLU92_14660 [Candidatus Dormibacteraeota bacterium]|nr:hypothetical protein [Candidatus Dormibacteraeota bacterium]